MISKRELETRIGQTEAQIEEVVRFPEQAAKSAESCSKEVHQTDMDIVAVEGRVTDQMLRFNDE